MQKARRLMDENSVSFQMFLILLSSITLGSEAKFPCSKKVRAILRSLFCFVSLYGGSMRRSQNLKKELHKALRSVQFLASFTSFHFEILSYLACA